MYWRQRILTWLLVVLSGALLAAGSQGVAPRVVLLRDVRVSTDAILLATLLPANAPASIRASAAEIFLGSAPQQGATRRFRGADIAEAITRSGLAVSRFQIPDEISVVCDGRGLNAEELLASIRAAVGQFPLSPSAEQAILGMQAGDLTWDSEFRVALGDARLKVEQMRVEPETGQASFRMSVLSQEHGVPFEVIASVAKKRQSTEAETARAGASGGYGRSGARGLPNGPDNNDEPVLIKAGHTARLHLHSENSSIFVDVLALDAGHAGETIRVRMPLGGSTMRALVTGPAELDATF